MDNKTRVEEMETWHTQLKELFKESVSEDCYEVWADTFEIEEVSEEQIVISYHGVQEMRVFKRECKNALWSCVCSLVGDGKKMKIVEKREQTFFSPKVKKNIKAAKFFVIGMGFAFLAAAIILMMCNYIGNRSFRETFHSVSSIKINKPIRVIQISDLHGCSYGKENEKLLTRVRELKPDLILCTGDMVDSVEDDMDQILMLSGELAKIAPTYYVYGNNEVEDIYDIPLNEIDLDAKFDFTPENRDETKLLDWKDPYEEKLEKTGIKVLKNEQDSIKVGTTDVDIFGVLTSNPSSFWSYAGTGFQKFIYEETDNLKIMAIHEPFIFEEFETDYWADVMFCGHTHGGVARIPVLGPLYTHEGGFFPERSGDFVYGRYDAAGRPLIVSSGLENSNPLRMNNQPELVIVDINKF